MLQSLGKMLSAYAHETITVTSGAAIGLTVGTYMTTTNHPKGALVSIGANDIMFTVDGTTPTSTVGHPGYDKDVVELWGQDIQNWKAIATGTDAKLHVTYYGEGAKLA